MCSYACLPAAFGNDRPPSSTRLAHVQAVSYVYIIARLDWTAEARAVAARAAASSTAHVDAPRVAAAALPGAGQGRAQNDRENASAV